MTWATRLGRGFLALFFSILTVTGPTLHAEEKKSQNLLENPKFEDGEKKWKSKGKTDAVELEDGDEKIKVLEIDLSKRRTTEIGQRFDPPEGATKFYIEAIVKASKDFKVNKGKALPWNTKGRYMYSPPQRPPNDFLIEIVDHPYWHYKAGALKPGGKWKKIHYTFDDLSPVNNRGKEWRERLVTFIAPPGEGKIWIKSLKVVAK